MTKMTKRKPGFSIVEMLVAIGILAIIAMASSPLVSRYLYDMNVQKTAALVSEANDVLGKMAVRAGTLSFISAGDNPFSAAFSDEDKKNEFHRLMARTVVKDAFDEELKVYSTYDDASLTGTVIVYAPGDDMVSVDGISLSVRKRGEEPIAVYTFKN